MDETCGLFEAINKMPLPALSITSVGTTLVMLNAGIYMLHTRKA